MPHHSHSLRFHHKRHGFAHVQSDPVIASPPERVHLVPREASTSCQKGDTSPACEKPAGATSTAPIIVGTLIPIVIALFVLAWLHRRHTQKIKREDAMDKTKSMDFGMEFGPASKARSTAPQGEKPDSRSRKQLSMDMDVVASPYLLPAAVVKGSGDSVHSMARTVHSVEDRYGQAHGTMSPSRSQRKRDSSVYTRQDSPDGSRSHMDSGLLDGAQRMPTSTPPPTGTRKLSPPIPQIALPEPAATRAPSPGLPSSPRDGNFNSKSADAHGSAQYTLPPSIRVGAVSPFDDPEPHADQNTMSRPLSDEPSEYGDTIQFRFSTASNDVNDQDAATAQYDDRKSLAPGAFDSRRLSMGFRPLPPEGKPDDTAEERAMRIRSFYKEYFSVEDSAASAPPMPQPPAAYREEYNKGYDDTTVFDSETGRFVVPGAKPFAEPPTRRAMTPPPRMPPRFNGPQSRAGSAAGGRFMPPPGPRSFSSASGRHPGGPGPQPPRRPLEPPKPLAILPTPSKLSEDAFASPIMFAPPEPIRLGHDDSAGRGGLRPYSPTVSPHIPLASAFDELPVMPSPHLLRKSGTFTALDFAPPKKFKNEGSEFSDAGSIRSNTSGASALHVQNIRNGAYRVSRIPTEVVPLKQDITAGLKPTWDMRQGS